METTKGIGSHRSKLSGPGWIAVYALFGAAGETVLTVIAAEIHLEYLIVAPFFGALCGLAGWVGLHRAEQRKADGSPSQNN